MVKISYEDEQLKQWRKDYARGWRARNRYEHREVMREYMRLYRKTPEGKKKCRDAEKRYAQKLRAVRDAKKAREE